MNGALLAAAAALLGGPVAFEVATRHTADESQFTWPAQPARFPGGVTAVGDVIFAQPLHYRPLRLDVYRPAKAAGPLPLIVHVHGGAWVNGTKRLAGPIRDFPAVLAQFAARGFIVASVEYRLDGEAKFPAAIQDVKAAIGFLRQHAGSYGIDPARVGIFGESAGGQLAALAATACGIEALEPAGAAGSPNTCVQAAAPWYGVYDFATVPTPDGQTGPAPYLGCPSARCSAETMRFASPITYVDGRDPPMLLIHGTADTLVAPSQSVELEQRLRSAGVPVETLYISGVDHGLVGTSTAMTADALNRALIRTISFFQQKLKATSGGHQ